MTIKNTIQISVLLVSGLLVSACGGGDTPPLVTTVTGDIDNGRIYYLDNCSACHAAGIADGTTALGGPNLIGLEGKIKSNMADYGGSYLLMSNFVDIPAQRIADLKVFLSRQ